MNEVSVENLLLIIGEQTVEIKILRVEIAKLKKELSEKDK